MNKKTKKLPIIDFRKEMLGIKTKKKYPKKEIKKQIEIIKTIPIEVKKELPKLEENITEKIPMPNHIQEYFAKAEGTNQAFHSRELFKAEKQDIDVKTDINLKEIILLNKLFYNNEFLRARGLKPVYSEFLNKYMRLKISLDRKSRGEFVSVNRGDKMEEATQLMSHLSNITGAKK